MRRLLLSRMIVGDRPPKGSPDDHDLDRRSSGRQSRCGASGRAGADGRHLGGPPGRAAAPSCRPDDPAHRQGARRADARGRGLLQRPDRAAAGRDGAHRTHTSRIFAKLGLEADEATHRRVSPCSRTCEAARRDHGWLAGAAPPPAQTLSVTHPGRLSTMAFIRRWARAKSDRVPTEVVLVLVADVGGHPVLGWIPMPPKVLSQLAPPAVPEGRDASRDANGPVLARTRRDPAASDLAPQRPERHDRRARRHQPM